MTSPADLRRGLLWALFGSAMAAAFMVPWKAAADHGEPRLAVFCMLTSAAVFNTALSGVEALRRGTGGSAGSWRPTLALASVFALLTLAGNSCSAHAIARISGALLAVVQRSEVILVAVLGALLLKERVDRLFWLGAALAALGLWVLKSPGSDTADFDPAGVLFGLGSAGCFGSMLLLSRRFITRVHLLPFNALRLWLSIALWCVVEGGVPRGDGLPAGLLVNAALAGFFGPFLSRLGSLLSGRYIPAQLTALTALSSPVLTLVLAFLVLGNLPTQTELIGGAVLLAGIAVPTVARLRRPGAAAGGRSAPQKCP